MEGEVLIKVDGVSKKFCRDLKKSLWYGVRDICSDLKPFGTVPSTPNGNTQPLVRSGEFWGVDRVSFELRRGECLALIGRNGAGKTTLLKMLNGLIRPDVGQIEMRGRVGALIALGAGFNPILTGRENIYVNGSVLGLSKKEISASIESIIDFAEVREFIDTPVQSYSSGMQVRLGFAIATALKPDILLLDEVLAVGDAAFRAKCYNRISKLQKTAAVIFVSHSMEQVTRICTHAMCLARGKVLHLGDVGEAVRVYSKINEVADEAGDAFLSLQDHIMDGAVRLARSELHAGEWLEVEICCRSAVPLEDSRMRVVFFAADGSMVAEYDSRGPVVPRRSADGRQVFARTIGPINLLGGRYALGVNLLGIKVPDLLLWSHKQLSINVVGATVGIAICQIGAKNE